MRWLVLCVLAWLAIPALALAKPKVAVAPLEDDQEDRLGYVVVDAADEHAKVTGPKQVGKEMDSLGITGALTSRSIKKLRAKLEVDVVVHGKVDRDGGKKRLELTVSGRGKASSTFELKFKTTADKSFRKELRTELAKRIDFVIERGGGGSDDEDDEDAPKKKLTDDDRPKKHDDDRPKKHDDDRPKKRTADDDSSRTRRRSDDDEDERPRKRKHRRGGDTDDERPRNPVTQAAVFVDAGGAVGRRTLTYKQSGVMPPPRVGTAAAAVRIDGEIYPASFSTLKGAAAGLGVAVDFAKSIGLKIAVPGTTNSTPIDEGHYAIGARYRFVTGASSLAVGASYWRRFYIADRSSLAMPTLLDMPDVDYTAIAPVVTARVAATPTVGVFGLVDLPLVLATGQITSGTSYGSANVFAFDVDLGVDIALAPHYALRIEGELAQIGLTFNAKPGSMAALRGVSAATDRTTALTATVAITY